jgi:phosphoglycolate phosphatase
MQDQYARLAHLHSLARRRIAAQSCVCDGAAGRRRAMTGPIRGVLFDKDGTLFDFTATWRGFADRFLIALAPEDADLRRRLGLAAGYDPDTGAFRAGSPMVAGATSEVAAAWAELLPGRGASEIERWANAAAETIGGPELQPAADLSALFRTLRGRGLALGVATHDAEASARAHLAAADALPLLDFLAGYDSGHGLKPGPGMVLAFAAAARIAPAQVVMVGDSAHDMGAARAAGAAAVAVLTGPATEADLSPLADVVLPSIAALPEWLAARERGAALSSRASGA